MNSVLMWGRFIVGGAVGLILAACTAPVLQQASQEPKKRIVPECTAAVVQEPLVGNWLNKRQEKGVTGELRTLFTLKADGSMLFTEQLKRPRQPSQGINETGCWYREAETLVLQTYTSNGVPVDPQDPIYTNRYRVLSVNQEQLTLINEQGVELQTQRSSPGYRLPF